MPMPELTVIVPTLNEAPSLPLLLADLAGQIGIACEVIVSDGGSEDSTRDIADAFFVGGRLQGKVLNGRRGRGCQLNRGAGQAAADWLLFLHADSRLPEKSQLRTALDFMRAETERAASDSLAGRFTLRFAAETSLQGVGLAYYEAKARLGRPGCIHGDQGLMLAKSFFRRVGPFREDLPVMEDTSLAERIRAAGHWCLLPGEIITSARRFATEGLMARQTLNALMMNFLAIGWLDFIVKAPDVYQEQDRARPLQLLPFLRLIRELMQQLPLRQRLAVWTDTGGYVRSQVWQLGLALDCRQAFRSGSPTTCGPGYWSSVFDRRIDPFTDHAFGRGLATLLVWGWFHWQLCRGWWIPARGN